MNARKWFPARSILLVLLDVVVRTRVVVLLTVLFTAVTGVLPSAPAFASLPDKRVYEQVSPPNKNGNMAGVDVLINPLYTIATSDGNALLYGATGAVGEAAGSPILEQPVVARRAPGKGWASASAIPRQVGPWSLLHNQLSTLVPSGDLSYMAFTAIGSYVAKSEPADPLYSPNIYLVGPGAAGSRSPDPFVEPTWLGRPLIADPIPGLGENTESVGVGLLSDILPAGPPSPSGKTYFAYSGTLLPEDASRAPHVGNGLDEENNPVPGTAGYFTGTADPWGFYEWDQGVLRDAGTLPADSLYPGEPDPWGAEPSSLAGNPHKQTAGGINGDVTPASFGNEVSSDGSRAFFVSPDPRSEHPVNDPPQLYVRQSEPDGTTSTVLVSQDALLPPVNGLPAPAPDGVTGLLRPQADYTRYAVTSFAYATPDGSRVFFASTDRLTGEAPSDGNVKDYEFELGAEGSSGKLTYLPGVIGPVLTVTADGSRVLFENTGSQVPVLELWQRSSQGVQTITPITQLPTAGETSTNQVGPCVADCVLVPDAYASGDGSVFAFETDSPLAGGFNNGGGFEQVYRYEVTTGKLDCVSCPPEGVVPSGDANLSHDSQINFSPARWQDSRGLSEDGSQVFFDSPDALVTQDVNGVSDVYEWENGHLFLLSDGTTLHPSFYLDSSASGGDAFFATVAGLVPGDRDGGYDVYDARVPQPGDNPPPAAVPCQGEVCQGPPSVPSLLDEPSSATFSGLGNIVQPAQAKPRGKPKQKPKHKKKIKKKKARAKRTNGRGGR